MVRNREIILKGTERKYKQKHYPPSFQKKGGRHLIAFHRTSSMLHVHTKGKRDFIIVNHKLINNAVQREKKKKLPMETSQREAFAQSAELQLL